MIQKGPLWEYKSCVWFGWAKWELEADWPKLLGWMRCFACGVGEEMDGKSLQRDDDDDVV